jgi:type III pantothenate kinase
MKVYMDAGNTFIKCIVGQANKQIPSSEFVRFPELFPPHDQIDHLYISSVLNSGFYLFVSTYCQDKGIEVSWVKTPSRGLGIQVGYDEPEQLGVDRFLAMAAAYDMCKRDCVVIDAGSAVTMDAVDVQGNHLGGVIIPGQKMMREALGMSPGISSVAGSDAGVFGKRTADGVTSGCLNAVQGGIRAILSQMKAELDDSVVVFATGGDASLVVESVGKEVRLCQNLVLDGLRLFADT